MGSLRFAALGASLCFCTASAYAAEAKTSTPIQDAVGSFNSVVQAASEALGSETKQSTSVRRDEAIAYFLRKGDDPENITHAGVERSFANYVCAGSLAKRRETAALKVLTEYSSVATGIVAPGGDTFAEQWSKLTTKPQEIHDLARDPKVGSGATPTAAFSACVTEVVRMIPPEGRVATDVSDEGSIVTAVHAVNSLADAIAALAKDGMAGANEVESRKRLKFLVNAQHEVFQTMLRTDLRPEVLDNAWTRRKERALLHPYYSFSHMLKDFDPSVRPYSVLEIAAQVNRELLEYDTLVLTRPPSAAIRALAEAETSLQDMVNNNSIAPGSILPSMKVLSGDLNALSAGYDDVSLSRETSDPSEALSIK